MEAEIGRQQESTQLRAIFTEVIWLIVSESLEDMEDVENFANSALFFRDIIRPKRTVFLFPKVWKIFGPRFEASENADWKRKGVRKEKLATCNLCVRDRFIRPYSGILKLRLVCRKWCHAIDIINDHDPPDSSTSFFHWTLQTFASYYDGAEYFQQFYRHFQSTHATDGSGRSPVVTRALSIIHDFNHPSRQAVNGQSLFNEIPIFLQKLGPHVTYCYIRLQFEAPFVESYARLSLWLSGMPNLKTLDLNVISCENGWEWGRAIRERDELEQAISLNPLPVMANLRFLTVESCPTQIFSELTRQHNHITTLNIVPGDTDNDDYDVSTVELSLQNLQEVSTFIDCPENFFLLQDAIASSPMTKLHLDTDHGDMLGYINWRRLFSMLHQCADTLTELALTLPLPRDENEQTPLQLKLDNITRLKLTLPYYVNLDFILPMKETLQYLEIILPKYEGEEHRIRCMKSVDEATTIKFFSCICSQDMSNLWDIFPKLKHVGYYEKTSNGENDLGFHDVLICSWQRNGRIITEINVRDQCNSSPCHTRSYISLV